MMLGSLPPSPLAFEAFVEDSAGWEPRGEQSFSYASSTCVAKYRCRTAIAFSNHPMVRLATPPNRVLRHVGPHDQTVDSPAVRRACLIKIGVPGGNRTHI